MAEIIKMKKPKLSINVIIILWILTLLGWSAEIVSLYYTENYFFKITNGRSWDAQAIALFLGFVIDAAKWLGLVSLVVFAAKHVWFDFTFEIQFKKKNPEKVYERLWRMIKEAATYITEKVISLVASILMFIGKELKHSPLFVVIILSVLFSIMATNSNYRVDSRRSNLESQEYKNAKSRIQAIENHINSLRSKQEVNKKQIITNTERISKSAQIIDQTIYKGLEILKADEYRSDNSKLGNENFEIENEIAELEKNKLAWSDSLITIEHGQSGQANELFAGIQMFYSFFGKEISIDTAIYNFSAGLEIIGLIFLGMWARFYKIELKSGLKRLAKFLTFKAKMDYWEDQSEKRKEMMSRAKVFSDLIEKGYSIDEIKHVFACAGLPNEIFRTDAVLTIQEINRINEIRRLGFPNNSQKLDEMSTKNDNQNSGNVNQIDNQNNLEMSTENDSNYVNVDTILSTEEEENVNQIDKKNNLKCQPECKPKRRKEIDVQLTQKAVDNLKKIMADNAGKSDKVIIYLYEKMGYKNYALIGRMIENYLDYTVSRQYVQRVIKNHLAKK